MYQVTFRFENNAPEVVATAAPDSTLLDVARSANVAIDAPCSGNGSCGKCRVKLVEGTVDGPKTGHITEEEYAEGHGKFSMTDIGYDIVNTYYIIEF